MKEFLILILTILMISCSAERDEDNTAISTQEYPDQETWNTNLLITKDGMRIGYLKATHVKKYSARKMTYFEDGLQVDFYNSNGEHTSVLNSDGGWIHDVKQDMYAYGNVVVISDSGATLYTDTLQWDNKLQKIISNIPVKITTEDDTLYGDSFISDPGLSNYELINSRGSSSKKIVVE
ncbi:MAG: LPS export ABC transporter periplasmic protein LptC [Calditrichaceae bacterium]